MAGTLKTDWIGNVLIVLMVVTLVFLSFAGIFGNGLTGAAVADTGESSSLSRTMPLIMVVALGILLVVWIVRKFLSRSN